MLISFNIVIIIILLLSLLVYMSYLVCESLIMRYLFMHDEKMRYNFFSRVLLNKSFEYIDI